MSEQLQRPIFILVALIIFGVFYHAFFLLLGIELAVIMRVLNPIMWILLALFVFLICKTSARFHQQIKKSTLLHVVFGTLLLLMTQVLMGLVTGFAYNPFDNSLRGILINFWIFGVPIIALEIIRQQLIHNVRTHDKKTTELLIVISFTLIQFNTFNFFTTSWTPYFVLQALVAQFIPLVTLHFFLNYITTTGGLVPAIIFTMTPNFVRWTLPILPSPPWIMTAFLDIIAPVLLLIYLYHYHGHNRRAQRTRLRESLSLSLIPSIVAIVVFVWFSLGLFPVKPFVIVSNSMYPYIEVGDVVFLKETDPLLIEIQDVIGYIHANGVVVVHRVIAIENHGEQIIFVTKGDNNPTAAVDPVLAENIVGVHTFRIPLIGRPMVWLRRGIEAPSTYE